MPTSDTCVAWRVDMHRIKSKVLYVLSFSPIAFLAYLLSLLHSPSVMRLWELL
jgi:hypothetical protein